MENRKRVLLVVLSIVMVFGLNSVASAICWQDNVGGFWKLSVGDFKNQKISEAHGFRQALNSCNGSQMQPTTGSMVKNAAGDFVLGVTTTVNEPAVCAGVTWHVVLDKTTLNGTGGWRNQVDNEGTFTLTKIPCADIPPVPASVSNEGIFDPSMVNP